MLLAWFVSCAAASDPATHVYQVGVLNDNYPFSYASPDGAIEGFVVDLLAEIEKVSGLKLERHVGGTREINGAFETGKLDLLQSYARSSERESFAEFSQPYIRMNGSIFVQKKGPKLKSLADLKGRRVMVHHGSKGEQILRAAGLDASIVYVDSVEESLRRLSAGECDATLVSRLSGLATARHLGITNLVATGDPLYEVDYCFAALKDHGDLVRRIDEAVLILRQPGGAYEKIYRKWFGELGGYSRADVILAVAVGLAIALVVAVWALGRQRALHRKIIEQSKRIQAEEERYRSVFEATMDALVVLSPATEGKDEFIVEQANPAARKLLGIDALSHQPLSTLLPCGDLLVTAITAVLAGKNTSPFEHDCSIDDRPLWLRVSVGRIGNRPLVLLANITESRLAAERLKRQEEQLRQNQKLEAIGTLASGVAHDFNNILASIVGNAELALLDVPADHPAQSCLNDIVNGSLRARKLVSQILTFSRKSEPMREVLAIGPLIDETLNLLRATVPKSIEFIHSTSAEFYQVEADPTQLHQVLLNLCTNAVHALRDRQGRIEIVEDQKEVTAGADELIGRLKPGSYVHIAVRDNGCGMPPDVQQRIFEPFFTTKPVGEGTGLGLSVVHGIMKSHGGDITVYSKPGQGTVFHLYLPAAKRQITKPSRPPVIPRGQGERILVVDDDSSIAQAASRLLTKIGYDAVTFTDSRAAMEALRKDSGRFQAVVCDLTMPGLNGLELAEPFATSLPFILISGYINEEDKQRALRLGVRRVIHKPIDLQTLANAVAESLAPRES